MTTHETLSKVDQAENTATLQRHHQALIFAGVVLGIGQAGFCDGIIFHQLLQWHHMFSSVESDATVAGLELNTLGDGLFHLFDWLATLVGIFLLWRVKQARLLSGFTLCGSILLGFGLFNLLEGTIDHHLLGIHHVKSGEYTLAYDLGFLGISAVIAGIGLWIIQGNKPPINEINEREHT